MLERVKIKTALSPQPRESDLIVGSGKLTENIYKKVYFPCAQFLSTWLRDSLKAPEKAHPSDISLICRYLIIGAFEF